MWRPIKDYEMYEINTNGSIRREGRILKNQIGTNLYFSICLCKNGIIKRYRVHRLLAQAFILNPNDKPCINHKDGDRQNNSLDNLEWCTTSENMLHAIHVTKTKISPKSMSGKFGCNHNRSKSFWIKNKEGYLTRYGSGLQFMRETGIDHTNIANARSVKKSPYIFKKGKAKGLTVYFKENHEATQN